MSTRCQITDGYPSSVLPMLLPFVKTFRDSRGHDACYMSARLCVAIAQDFGTLLPHGASEGYKPWTPDYLSLGVDAILHGDIEYLYVVGKDGTVHVYDACHFGLECDLKPGTIPGPGVLKLLDSFTVGTDADAAVAACEAASQS